MWNEEEWRQPMRLFGLSKASMLAWARPTGRKDWAWHCLNFSLISPRSRTGIRSKGGGGSKTNVPWRRNCPYHHILALFPEIAHNEQLIILWLRLPQHTRENKLPSIPCISSSHRAQVITPCSTSLQQILSVTDRATLLFSVEGIFKLYSFFFLSLNLF